MASIYLRPDSRKLWLSFYPRPGADLVRGGLGTDDVGFAKKAAEKVELLIQLEAFADIVLPPKALEAFESFKPPVDPHNRQTLTPATGGKNRPLPKSNVGSMIRAFGLNLRSAYSCWI